MKLCSFDTNILIYAADEDCAEHDAAIGFMESALQEPENWIVADQILFEFYKALRNPKIFRSPLSAPEAAKRVRYVREHSGFAHCCYEWEQWNQLAPELAQKEFPYQRTHDLVLGITLKANGINRFYTRNTKDFFEIGFDELINPID